MTFDACVAHERSSSHPTHVVQTHPIDYPLTFALRRQLFWACDGGRAWEIIAVTISGTVIAAEYPHPQIYVDGGVFPMIGPREFRAFNGDVLQHDLRRQWDNEWGLE